MSGRRRGTRFCGRTGARFWRRIVYDGGLDVPRIGHLLHDFVIELHSRRVHIGGSTPHPNEAFMFQVARHLTDAADGVLHEGRAS